jgi:hypothetical protein
MIVELTAVPNSGFAFQGWSGDITSTENPLQVEISGNLSLTAEFYSDAIDGRSLELSIRREGTQLRLSWAENAGTVWVQRRADLVTGEWENWLGPLTGNSVLIEPEGEQMFFRLVIEEP